MMVHFHIYKVVLLFISFFTISLAGERAALGPISRSSVNASYALPSSESITPRWRSSGIPSTKIPVPSQSPTTVPSHSPTSTPIPHLSTRSASLSHLTPKSSPPSSSNPGSSSSSATPSSRFTSKTLSGPPTTSVSESLERATDIPPGITNGDLFSSTSATDFPITAAITQSSPDSTTESLPIITSYNLEAVTISGDGTKTTNTKTKTGDSKHATADVPILFGCAFCPSNNGGIVLWGMSKPGIYPPPIKPPTPAWPTIRIGDDLIPTPEPSSNGDGDDDDDDDDKTKTTNTATSTSTTSTDSSSSTESSSTDSQTTTRTDSQSTSTKSTETSSSATSTAPTDSCDGNSASKRFLWPNFLVRRDEITTELDDPLGTALSYLGVDGLKTANSFVTNKMAGDREYLKNTWAMGVGGTYELPRGGVKIEGVHLTGKIPWMVRWDTDPVKGVHINGVWGKGPGRVKVAYKFHPDEEGKDTNGWNALKEGVGALNKATKIKTYRQRTLVEEREAKVSFKDGGNEENAVQAVVEKWTELIGKRPC